MNININNEISLRYITVDEDSSIESLRLLLDRELKSKWPFVTTRTFKVTRLKWWIMFVEAPKSTKSRHFTGATLECIKLLQKHWPGGASITDNISRISHDQKGETGYRAAIWFPIPPVTTADFRSTFYHGTEEAQEIFEPAE